MFIKMTPSRPGVAASIAAFGFCILLLLSSIKGSWSLRLEQLLIPKHVVRHSDTEMECRFNLDNEVLYSVKWYKDGHEFYRFVPQDKPKKLAFEVLGVRVNIVNSTENKVILHNVTLESSGRYRCEVSAEAPSFQTVTDHADMRVVATPSRGPEISGGKQRYQVDDWVYVNCTSGKSNPATNLQWFINGIEADKKYLHGPWEKKYAGEDLVVSKLGLKFKVKLRHFEKGELKLKCLATINSIYWKVNEESSGPSIPPRAPALESRESRAPPNKSRADRVHAAGVGSSSSRSSSSSSLLCILNILLVLLCLPVR